ncbi:MAG TPA: hypothetical protein VK004_02355, partial [Ignavibacteria bacterium]|nr:hypothetical protein [Ignavibacteria bacterium]
MTNPGVNTALLYRFFVKLDFRDKNKAGFTKIIGVLVAYLFANTLLSFGNYAGFDEFSYVILSMSTNVFLLAFVVMNDFVNLFVGKGEGEAIQSLPVKEENIFFARFFAAYTMIAFFAVSIILPQIYFFSKYDAGLLSVILFILCIFLFNIFFISFLVMIYTLVLRYAKKTAHFFIYTVNIFFLVYVFYSTSLKGKAASLGK